MATLAVRSVLARRAAALLARRQSSVAFITPAEEFPDIPASIETPAKASTASVTAISNGLTLVSETASSTSTVTLTFPRAGSADETLGEAGAALVNQCLNFKSAPELSASLLMRILEDNGAESFSSSGRRGATVGFTAAPDKALELIPLLATDCAFEKWDVRDARKIAGVQIDDASACAEVVLTEQLFAAAYGAQSPMGRPYYCNDASMDAIQSFRKRAYGLNGAVLAATGMPDHARFVTAAEVGLSEAATGYEGSPAPATYIGGEARVAADSKYAHVALGFEGPSSTPLLNVLKHCLTMMGSDGVQGFATPGLVGVYSAAPSANAFEIVDSLSAALVSKPSADIFKRAKALAKAEALFALDSGSKSLAASMTQSVLETGTFSAAGMAEAYDAITEKDVTGALSAMLKSNPSLAAVGDIATVPYQGSIKF